MDEWDELLEEFVDHALDGIGEEAMAVNDMLEFLTRVDKGQLRFAIMSNWATGRRGGTLRPPRGRYTAPGGEAILEALKSHVFGNWFSTVALVPQEFWLGRDQTLEQIAESRS